MRGLVAIVLCTGCYNPSLGTGTACDTECPGDLACIDHVCREAGYMPGTDAGPSDAAAPDMLDGPPGDGDGDGVTDNSDNCPAKANPDQHDEDADVMGDVCDPCPHLSGDAADGDGDGVGDACDPQPMIDKQRIKFFDPFTSDLVEWTAKSNASRVGDTMRLSAVGYSGMRLDVAQTESRITVGGSVAALSAGATEHQIAIAFGRNQSGSIYHYTEFYDEGSGGEVAISRANQGTYTTLMGSSYAGSLALGGWAMQIDASVAAQTIALTGKRGGNAFPMLMASTSTAPMLTGGAAIQIDVNGVDVRLDYFLVIETLP